MTHSSLESHRRPRRRWAPIAALAAALLLPGAAAPALADPDHDHHHGSECRHGCGSVRYYAPPPVAVPRPYPAPYPAPIRVRYYRPYLAPTYYMLPSPYVFMHGPAVAGEVVYYPAGAPVIYAPGYCPRTVHYHPYAPRPGVHGSFSLRIGF